MRSIYKGSRHKRSIMVALSRSWRRCNETLLRVSVARARGQYGAHPWGGGWRLALPPPLLVRAARTSTAQRTVAGSKYRFGRAPAHDSASEACQSVHLAAAIGPPMNSATPGSTLWRRSEGTCRSRWLDIAERSVRRASLRRSRDLWQLARGSPPLRLTPSRRCRGETPCLQDSMRAASQRTTEPTGALGRGFPFGTLTVALWHAHRSHDRELLKRRDMALTGAGRPQAGRARGVATYASSEDQRGTASCQRLAADAT